MEKIYNELLEIYKRKNADYGDSFSQSCDEHGIIAAVVRIGDKYNRLRTLTKHETEVKDESIRDTLMDMANYCAMTAKWLDEHDK